MQDKKSKICIEDNDQTVRTTLAPLSTPEHTKVYSRTLRRDLEIGVGMHGRSANNYGGLVPANPFASKSQMAFLNMHPEKLGAKGLAEWNESSKGLKLPKHVKKAR